MTVQKPAIPVAPKDDPKRARFDLAIKECLERIMGRRGSKIEPLPANATIDDVIAKVNEIIGQLQ